uniref:Uncharacterized protein n=1 Tax=viral metagenome TaxID=1070528 RepID=A0A6C0K1M3_9ZZZZ
MSANKQIDSLKNEIAELRAEFQELKAFVEKMGSPPQAEKKTRAKKDDDDKIEVCRKNIALWQSKLDDGKVKDVEKQQEKIDKEKKKLDKLLGSVEEESPKKAPKESPKQEKKDKRIKRWSPAMTTALTNALKSVDLEFNDSNKKECVAYIEGMNDDDYSGESLTTHIKNFAESKRPANAGAGYGPPPTPEEDEAKNQAESEKDEGEEDEEYIEVKFQQITYAVGEKSGRVYKTVDGEDVFTGGFIGKGQFEKMKLPKA